VLCWDMKKTIDHNPNTLPTARQQAADALRMCIARGDADIAAGHVQGFDPARIVAKGMGKRYGHLSGV